MVNHYMLYEKDYRPALLEGLVVDYTAVPISSNMSHWHS
jgi:hypothetical protein